MLGAVFTDRPIVQPLTQLVWLGRMHERKPQYQGVARLFAALSMGIAELEAFYTGVDFNVPSEARFYPHITSFVDPSTKAEVKFRYEGHVDPSCRGTKAVFLAETEKGRKIIVKFTEVYNDEAHTLLATQGLAPQLLSCDRSTLTGFVMIVMDYIDGKQLRHWYPQGRKISTQALEQVKSAMNLLHANEFVFGDLRWPNILVTSIKGEDRIQLVDFDWCGKVGVTEYPADINLVDIEWPKDVVPGGLMRFEHDEEMLSRL